jgi:hypothetical protein
MHANLMTYDMAAAVERERMVERARPGRTEMVAEAGHDGGPTARVRTTVSALARRLGRPRSRGAAPAAAYLHHLEMTKIDHAREAIAASRVALF